MDQNLHIVFSHARRQRPVEEIVKELSDFIQSTTTAIASLVRTNPACLLGKHISHKFEIEESKEKWYVGTIISYDLDTRLFEIAYEEDEEHWYFDLTEDAAMDTWNVIMYLFLLTSYISHTHFHNFCTIFSFVCHFLSFIISHHVQYNY